MLKKLFNHPVVNLDKQIRFSNLKVMFPENVAEHSEIVANLAMIIALMLMEENNIKIDLKEIAYRGVIHDWGESVTCDVTTNIKYSYEGLADILEKIEEEGLKRLFNDDIINDINNSRKGCLEGDLIMLSDRLQCFFKMMKEYMIQRTESWKKSILDNSIPSIKDLIIKMKSIYNFNNGILDEILSGVEESKNIILDKKDFL